MGALLKFLLLGVLGLWLWYSPAVRKLWGGTSRSTAQGATRRPTGEPATPESMVRCAHCGVHLPYSEALTSPDGSAYCCAAHRDEAHPQAKHG